jgi:hypothetical protein
MVFSARLLMGWLGLRRLRRGAAGARAEVEAMLERLKERLGVRGLVAVLETARVEVPSVIGVLRPVVLFPASALTGIPAEQLEGLLAHELAHIRRHDYLVNLLQSVVETLLFYHPAVWWVSGRIREEREHCCDDMVVGAGVGRVVYARALAEMERLRGSGGLAMAANSGALLARVRRVLGVREGRKRSGNWVALSSVVSVGVVLLVLAYVLGCSGERSERSRAGGTGGSPVTVAPQIDEYPAGFQDPGSVEEARRKVAEYDEAMEAGRKKGMTENHPEMVENRKIRDKWEGVLEAALRKEKESAAVRERLEKDIGGLEFDHEPLEKVIGVLQKRAGVSIAVNWDALKSAEVERSTPVTFWMFEGSFQRALSSLLLECGKGESLLGYKVDGSVLRVSTREDLKKNDDLVVVRVFDIQDLLFQPGRVAPPFGGIPVIQQRKAKAEKTRGMILREIVDTIMTTVQPQSWRDKGGKVGTIREMNGQLIIKQTMENQRAVHQLLNQLRETRSLYIAIEARLVFVDEATYKKLELAKGKDGGPPLRMFAERDIAGVLEALHASGKAVDLIAPRVTLFNGQNGYLATVGQENYIKGWTGKADRNGTMKPEPEVETLSTGVVLGAEATMSADRRFAVLKLNPVVRTLVKWEWEQVPTPAGVDARNVLRVQKPVVREVALPVMVTVPDRGMVAIGGEATGSNVFTVNNGWEMHGQNGMNRGKRYLVVLVRAENIVRRGAK